MEKALGTWQERAGTCPVLVRLWARVAQGAIHGVPLGCCKLFLHGARVRAEMTLAAVPTTGCWQKLPSLAAAEAILGGVRVFMGRGWAGQEECWPGDGSGAGVWPLNCIEAPFPGRTALIRPSCVLGSASAR